MKAYPALRALGKRPGGRVHFPFSDAHLAELAFRARGSMRLVEPGRTEGVVYRSSTTPSPAPSSGGGLGGETRPSAFSQLGGRGRVPWAASATTATGLF